MCFLTSNVRSVLQWSWEGDRIVYDPIIPASQRIPGTRKKYEIDIREYLLDKENAVVRRTLSDIVGELGKADQSRFLSRTSGSFDFRMQTISAYISREIEYIASSRKSDAWLFPDQTLANKGGDCEDRAFLLASLLIASGITSYVVRVALGKLYNRRTRKSADHVWVMYRNEAGFWMLVEPLLYTDKARVHAENLRKPKQEKRVVQGKEEPKRDTFEYIPYFVFNNHHMWSIRNNTLGKSFAEYISSRRFWSEFDPEFAVNVHNSVFDEVLSDLSWKDLQYVKQVSLAMDVTPFVYDPRDHFDNGYIAEGWQVLRSRIEEKSLDGLARAGHAIADFYAHSSYAHFAKRGGNGDLVLFDGTFGDHLFQAPPDYGQGPFALGDGKRFSVNTARCKMSVKSAIDYCNEKKIISGRFAQPDDPYQGFLEKNFVFIPYEFRSAKDFPPRTCLPHHNEIAVDDDLDDGQIPDEHKLYRTPDEFRTQFMLRQNAAISHFKELYKEWNLLRGGR